MRDTESIGDVDNNTDSKDAYIKADFSTYNVTDMGVGDTIDTGETVSNNTNKTGVGKLGRIGRAYKDGLGGTDKGRLDMADKDKINWADIETGKKASGGAVTSTNNSINGGGNVIHRHAGLASLAFIAFAAANCAGDSNFAVPEETSLGAVTSTSDNFSTTFVTLVNKTLEKEPNVCISNLFLFAANYQ